MSRKTTKIEKNQQQGIEETRTLFFKKQKKTKRKKLATQALSHSKKQIKITLRFLRAFVEILYSIKLENPRKMFNILDGYHLEIFGQVQIRISSKPRILKET